MNLELDGKVAIVTGGSRGLGFFSARALAKEGARVAICARGEARLREAADELRAVAHAPDRVFTVTADVASTEGVARVVEATVKQYGGLDILVNNVGVARGSNIVDTTSFPTRRSSDLKSVV